MNLFLICLSWAVAASVITPAASGAGADLAVFSDRNTDLNGDGSKQLQADPRRLATNKAVTCDATPTLQKPHVTAMFSETTLQASFTCGNDFNQGLTPAFSDNTTKCCVDGTATNDNADIKTVLGVKGKAVKSSAETVTVTLEKIPDDKRGQSIYYKCNKTTPSQFCLVALELPPAIDKNECAIDKVISLTLTKTAPSASFKCDNGKLTGTPFEVSNGKCSEVEKQTTAVKLLTPAGGDVEVAVGQLPERPEQLCYACTYANVPDVQGGKATTRMCSVVVTVEAATSSTSTATPSSARSIIMTSAASSILIGLFLSVAASS